MFKHIYFDISGICNGRCYWCQTGQSNINHESTGSFVKYKEFTESIHYMMDNGFIDNETIISLYNWGEPFLHPKFKEIISFLHKLNIKIKLSTNASYPVFFNENDILSNLVSITFSMPGFSQESYDKIHGFKFEKILKNIVDLQNNFSMSGFNGLFLIAYHIYQFNMDEIIPMIEFAKKHGIVPLPSFAYINDFKRMQQYLKKELDYEYLHKATQELFLFQTEDIMQKIPSGYVCPLFETLSIDSNCNVITCCSDSTVLDKIYNLKPQEIHQWRTGSDVCHECIRSGQSYILNNPVIPKHIVSLS